MARVARSKLSSQMTLRQFDHGYWYATEIKRFAQSLGLPSAHKLRKDELEKAIRHFLASGKVTSPTKRDVSRSAIKDVDRGLRLDLPVILYTNDHQTKAFLEREARKLDPAFKRRSGARYRLNRWRDAQLTRRAPITYRDLVKEYIPSQSPRDDVQASAGGSVRLLSQRFHGRESRGNDGGRHSGLEGSENNGLAQDLPCFRSNQRLGSRIPRTRLARHARKSHVRTAQPALAADGAWCDPEPRLKRGR